MCEPGWSALPNMHRGKLFTAAIAIFALLGTSPHHPQRIIGSFKIAIPDGPFISGSRLPIDAPSVQGPLVYSIAGRGLIERGQFVAPIVDVPTTTTVIGATRGAVAYSTVKIVPPPAKDRSLIAVASYENGVALHDPKTFALLGYAPIGGPPGDVAFSRSGDLFAPDTDGDTLTRLSRAPWEMHAVQGVQSGNEIAVDERTGDVFVSDRDVNGKGAVTRITPGADVTRVITGDTAEGLAVDSARGIVYVSNVNSNTVAQVRIANMTVMRTIRAVDRAFGLALDGRAQRLYVVANVSPTMRTGGGFVAAIDLRRREAPIVGKSAAMTFPLGVALDSQRQHLFVTDEGSDVVYVLNPRTLKPVRTALSTCRTPWRPRIYGERLYVPCARANQIDVFDLRTLRRTPHAPFATGGFPLSVALWP